MSDDINARIAAERAKEAARIRELEAVRAKSFAGLARMGDDLQAILSDLPEARLMRPAQVTILEAYCSVEQTDAFWHESATADGYGPSLICTGVGTVSHNPFNSTWGIHGWPRRASAISRDQVFELFKDNVAHWVVHEYPKEAAIDARKREELARKENAGCAVLLFPLLVPVSFLLSLLAR